MVDTDNGAKGIPGSPAGQTGPMVRVVGQYIKDLSFENPNVRKLLAGSSDKPNLRIEVNVSIEKIADNMFESAIQFKSEATNTAGVVYDLELSYAGLFHIENMPNQMLEPFLLVNCPALLFPYLRRLVADLTREGGFPPLTLDPIDFGQLYAKRQQEKAMPGAAKAN